MLIHSDDLVIGDEIIISNYSNLQYLKVLSKSKKREGYYTCSYFFVENPYRTSVFNCVAEEHNGKRSFYLANRDILLVKRP